MQDRPFSFGQTEVWISGFPVWHQVTQYEKAIQLGQKVAMVLTSITFVFLVLQQAVLLFWRDIRSNTKFCLVSLS